MVSSTWVTALVEVLGLGVVRQGWTIGHEKHWPPATTVKEDSGHMGAFLGEQMRRLWKGVCGRLRMV